MHEPDTITYLVNNDMVTMLVPDDEFTTHVEDNGTSQVIHLQEHLADIPFPVSMGIAPSSPVTDLHRSAGIAIMPVMGGGRGPVINNGQVIDLTLLLSLLNGVIRESELSPDLLARLDAVDTRFDTQADIFNMAQEGYAEHDDVITLNQEWTGKPPKIGLLLSHGRLLKRILTTSSIGDTSFEHITIPNQEAVYGHSGFTGGDTFTVKAAILEYVAPIDQILNWTPSNVIALPVTNTESSGITNTSVNCMGLRIKGTLGLASTATPEVAGSMYAQMSIDSGPWITIATFSHRFVEADPVPVTMDFDVMLAYSQAAHSYRFRGQAIKDSGDDSTRELTGSITIDKVTESGSGTILSNDLTIKWSVKE